jgi:hypothetical protein
MQTPMPTLSVQQMQLYRLTEQQDLNIHSDARRQADCCEQMHVVRHSCFSAS